MHQQLWESPTKEIDPLAEKVLRCVDPEPELRHSDQRIQQRAAVHEEHWVSARDHPGEDVLPQ